MSFVLLYMSICISWLITNFSGGMRTQLCDGERVVANYAKIISKSTKSISMPPMQKKALECHLVLDF